MLRQFPIRSLGLALAATAMLADAMTAPTPPVRSQRPTSENVMA